MLEHVDQGYGSVLLFFQNKTLGVHLVYRQLGFAGGKGRSSGIQLDSFCPPTGLPSPIEEPSHVGADIQ